MEAVSVWGVSWASLSGDVLGVVARRDLERQHAQCMQPLPTSVLAPILSRAAAKPCAAWALHRRRGRGHAGGWGGGGGGRLTGGAGWGGGHADRRLLPSPPPSSQMVSEAKYAQSQPSVNFAICGLGD